MADIHTIIAELKSEKDIFKKAKLLADLREKHHVPVKELAQHLRLTSSHICHIMRLNRVPEIIRDGYYAKMVSVTHLFILSRVKDKEMIMRIYEKLLAHGYTAQQVEEAVREHMHGVQSKGSVMSPDKKQEYKNAIEKIKGTRVSIMQSRIKSSLQISIKGSLEHTTAELEKILRKVTG